MLMLSDPVCCHGNNNEPQFIKSYLCEKNCLKPSNFRNLFVSMITVL